MGDRPQRSLRPRKPYPYLPPDVRLLYTPDWRPRPSQISPPQLQQSSCIMMQETVSPAMELNTNAKTLVKFFNSVNRGTKALILALR